MAIIYLSTHHINFSTIEAKAIMSSHKVEWLLAAGP